MRSEILLRDLFDEFGVNKYHSKGLFGNGIKILIVDTGMNARKDLLAGAEPNLHGYAVRCLIKAPANSHGLLGIAPEADLTLVDVYDKHAIPIDLLLIALRKAIDNKVDIISISLGTPDSYEPLQNLIDEAAEKGILIFAAAGNSGSRAYEYPASCFSAIAVGSVNVARQPSDFNTRNDSVVVFAPGERLRLPTGHDGELEEYNGTSFSTPWAAGLACLVLQNARLQDSNVKLTRRQMIDILRNPDHLDLNCEQHTYVMDKTCTNYQGYADNDRLVTFKDDVKSSATYINVGFFLLIAFIIIGLYLILPFSRGSMFLK
jgi:subtilisin family serine protease